jgi:hypothetical protein
MHSGQRGNSTPRSGSTGEKAFLGNPEGSQNKTVGGTTVRNSGEDDPSQTKDREPSGGERSTGRGPAYPKNSVVHLADKGVDTNHSEEGNKHSESGDENTSNHLSDTSALKGGREEEHHRAGSFLPRRPLHPGEIGVNTSGGEEPPQREARRQRNRRRNIRRHHEAGERNLMQTASRDEASEVGEASNERVHQERCNSHRRDRRQAQDREQELAEQDARLLRENLSSLETCTPILLEQ